MKALIPLTLLTLQGCAALQHPSELGYQALHLVDVAQTLEIAQQPQRYWEEDSSWLLGSHPSKGEVLGWGVGTAALHLAVSELLLRQGSPALFTIWQCLSVGATLSTVRNNYSIGLTGRF